MNQQPQSAAQPDSQSQPTGTAADLDAPQPSLDRSPTVPSNSALEPFVLTVPSAQTDSSSVVAEAVAAAAASSSSSLSNVPFDVSSLARSAFSRDSSVHAKTQPNFAAQSATPLPLQTALPTLPLQTALPSLPALPGQLPPKLDQPFNLHQQLIVLHAQALVLSDAVMKTQQFVEQHKLQKKNISKIAQNRNQKQFDQLLEHQQRQEQQFLTMLQRQQEAMQQNQSRISPQQYQQQQTQFFVYKQVMDNLIRRSRLLAAHKLTSTTDSPTAATADATSSQPQPLMPQHQFNQMHHNSGFLQSMQSSLYSQATLQPPNSGNPAGMSLFSQPYSSDQTQYHGIPTPSPQISEQSSVLTGAQFSEKSHTAPMQPNHYRHLASSFQGQSLVNANRNENQSGATHELPYTQQLSRPISFQESIQRNIEIQQRELDNQIQLQAQQKFEFKRQQEHIKAMHEAYQQKVNQIDQSSTFHSDIFAQNFSQHSNMTLHAPPTALQQLSFANAAGGGHNLQRPVSSESKKLQGGAAKQRMRLCTCSPFCVESACDICAQDPKHRRLESAVQ